MEEQQDEHDDASISKAELLGVLNRLSHYYAGRVRSARHGASESGDAQSACDHALSASRWEAKRDAIRTVAENLQIDLKEHTY